MTQEALKLALEALRMPCNYWNKTQFIKVKEAIAAAEEALAEHHIREVQRLGQEIEQEPVAWMWDVNNGAGYSSRGIGFYQTDIPFAKHTPLYTIPPQLEERNFCPRCGKRTKDIHTCTAPRRTWVGLTDEEENEYNYLGPDMHWVIQEIAAKLKEKNT
jgi:hypothetical protein